MKCSVCWKVVRKSHAKYQCECGNICHTNCVNESAGPSTHTWVCSRCFALEFPFNHIIDDEDFYCTLNAFFHSSMNIETSRLRASIIDVLSFDNQIELESEICNLDNLDSPCHYYFSNTFNEKNV